MNHTELIRAWLKGNRLNRFGRERNAGNVHCDEEAVYSYGHHFPLIKECANGYILNGDSYSNSTSGHQASVRYCMKDEYKYCIIPYTVLNLADINIRNIFILDKKSDEYKEYEYLDANGEKKTGYRHLLGGSLFKYNDRHFISANDPSARRWNSSYFLTEIKGKETKFDCALESLMPDEVRLAEESTVKRQGEWFFKLVASNSKDFKKKIGIFPQITVGKFIQRDALLPIVVEGQEPHHKVRDCVEFGNQIYVRGSVRHTQGQHKRLSLGESWHKAIPNVQVRSWSFAGKVD